MRHTAATLWLASGEAPEWIARQLGHSSTEMLFRVYSRYVPNLTRQDGSAMERLLASRLSTGALVPIEGTVQGGASGSRTTYVPAHEVAPQSTPKPRGVYAQKGAARNTGAPRPSKDEGIATPHAVGGREPQPPPWQMSTTGHKGHQPVNWPA